MKFFYKISLFSEFFILGSIEKKEENRNICNLECKIGKSSCENDKIDENYTFRYLNKNKSPVTFVKKKYTDKNSYNSYSKNHFQRFIAQKKFIENSFLASDTILFKYFEKNSLTRNIYFDFIQKKFYCSNSLTGSRIQDFFQFRSSHNLSVSPQKYSHLKIEHFCDLQKVFPNEATLNNICINTSKEKSNQKELIQKIREDIEHKPYFIWLTYILSELDMIDFEILNYFRRLKHIKGWYRLNKNCELFRNEIKNEIEFHIPLNFENMTIYRKKYYQKPQEFIYEYLVLKGNMKKDFKNLCWKGSKIFLMDCSKIGNDVTLHGNTYIGPGCKIGDNTCILNDCYLRKNVKIEKGTYIGKNNVFGEGCMVGIRNIENCHKYFSEKISLEKEEFKFIDLIDDKFKTKIGSFNFIRENFVVPYGVSVGFRNVFI